ncbi:hypothetical protein BH23PLA1_BH23PLA1_07760 [soil metagenome]
MTSAWTSILFGPLVVPECRRSAKRGWVILFRTLAGSAFVSVALIVVWLWWINQDWVTSIFALNASLRYGLAILLGLMVTLALVMSPAVLAGSLAGENERGSMGLLLTTATRPREIVFGRMFGKLSPIVMILLSGLPPLLFLGFLAGVRPLELALMVLLPIVVTFGAGGITAAAATVSRRGRDALLGAYLLGLFLLLAPVARSLIWTGGGGDLIDLINPFLGIGPLLWWDEPGPVLVTLAIWGGLGLSGTVLACCRLRPNSLKWLGGETRRRRGVRHKKLPAIADRPMFWKELYIERGGRIGGFGRWLGYLLVGYLLLASSIPALLIAWAHWKGQTAMVSSNRVTLEILIVDSLVLFSVLIQLAVGLRAAVAIASEREQGTWDALLTSPLEGREIVLGKLGGSLYALRWLFLAVLYAWGLAVIVGAHPLKDFGYELMMTVVLATFMAAVGVRTALANRTTALAMTLTIGIWFLALGVLAFLALLVVGLGAIVLWLSKLMLDRLGLTQAPGPWFPVGFDEAFGLTFSALFLLVTVLIVIESRVRFDRIAGRMSGGGVAVSVDRMIHGLPEAPVRIAASKPVRRASTEEFGEFLA